jgi:predicted RNase H-like HicB family nuclease
MDIEISFDPKHWYSAAIPKISTYTQGKTWDKLIYNINEAIGCYIEAEKKRKLKVFSKDLRFYLNFGNLLYAGNLQRNITHS